MPIGQRVLVVGGGHNALITAFYLAKGGLKPLVLERREMVGGGAVTEEFHPGFRASTLAHTVGPLRADIARDMRLDKHGLQMLYPDPRVFTPTPDGRALLFYNDHAKTAGGIARFSAKDAARGIFGTALGPWSAGSTAVLLLRAAADPHPIGSAAFPRGGLGSLTSALGDAARKVGVEIRTQAEVQHIRIKDGGVTSVVLADGEEITADAVLSGVDPKRTFFNLVNPS